MNNSERIKGRQTAAELRNAGKKIKHLERTGQAVPTELFNLRQELERRFRSTGPPRGH